MPSVARGRTAQGNRTREAIVRAAADIASVQGLDGLTIRNLADQLQMSVSGLYGHFGSKEGLQLATIEAARVIYVREVIAPSLTVSAGVSRLIALCDNFLSYVDREVFPGGCFFAAAMAEYDCKPGAVRDRIALMQAEWLQTLQRAATEGVALGQLPSDTDVVQLAFDLEAALLSANWYVHLFSDNTYLDRAKRSVRERITSSTRRGVSVFDN